MNNKLVKNYIYNVLYQIFLIVVPLVTAPYLTRTLSAVSLGIYDYINSITSIITTFGLIGLQSYGYRQIAYYRDNKRAVEEEFSSIFCLRIILLIIVGIIYLPLSGATEYKKYFWIQFFLIVAQFLDVSWLFIGFEDLKIVSLRNFIAKFITVIGIFLFVNDDNDLWLYFALFSFTTLVTCISVYPLAKKYVLFVKVDIKKIVSHISGSIKLFIPQVATLLYLQFDKVMLKAFTDSTAQVAYYSYAEKIINIPLAVITALGTVMMPRFANLHSNNDREAISNYLMKTIRFALFLAVPMMIGLAVISDGFIPWYLGNEYIVSATVIVVLSPVCILNALANILGAQYLTAVDKTKELTVSYYSAAFINIFLNAILIPQFACIGAAIATLFCSLTSVIMQFFYVKKDIHFYGIGANLLKNIFSALFMMIGIEIIKKLANVSAWVTLAEVFVGVIIYLIFSLLLKEANLTNVILLVKKGMIKHK